jgi:hypothetical protein
MVPREGIVGGRRWRTNPVGCKAVGGAGGAPLWRRAPEESRVGPRQRTSEGAIFAMARSAPIAQIDP